MDQMNNGLEILLLLAPIACVCWLAMMWLCCLMFGVHPREVLDEITLPEAVFFLGIAIACAHLVAAVFSRFIT